LVGTDGVVAAITAQLNLTLHLSECSNWPNRYGQQGTNFRPCTTSVSSNSLVSWPMAESTTLLSTPKLASQEPWNHSFDQRGLGFELLCPITPFKQLRNDSKILW